VDRLRVTTLIRFGIVGIIVGSGLLWWHPAHWVGFLGLALIGLAEAPIFPTLISVTPSRVGVGHADNAIGFQVAAAGLGGAGLSSLAGVLAEHLGLEIVGPFLLLFALVAFITHEAVVRWDGS
jgi:fucose permease